MSTRSSWDWDVSRRDGAKNEATVVVGLGGLFRAFEKTAAGSLAPPPSFEEAFVRHYGAILDFLVRYDQPGVLAIGIDARGLQGTLWLRGDDSLRTGIVGRHDKCGLFLPDDDAVSLRHVAVLVRDRRVRVLDLRTAHGFEDESGRRLRGVVADGPLLLTIARTRLFLLPTGRGAKWPMDGQEAWRALPPRTFADARPAEERGAVASLTQLIRLARPRPAGENQVTVTALRGAMGGEDLATLAAPGDEITAHLSLTDGSARATISIGRTATTRGVLIGRYDRCDVPFMSSHDRISRVHALLVREGDDVYAIDCASMNGTEVDGHAISSRPLGHRAAIRLAGIIDATWEATG